MAAGGTRSERRRLAAMVSVRFTPAEEQLVRRTAERAGESVSNFVRQAALRACEPEEGPNATISWTSLRAAAGAGPATVTVAASYSIPLTRA